MNFKILHNSPYSSVSFHDFTGWGLVLNRYGGGGANIELHREGLLFNGWGLFLKIANSFKQWLFIYVIRSSLMHVFNKLMYDQ